MKGSYECCLNRDVCAPVDCIFCANQITYPAPRSYFDGLSTSGPGPSNRIYEKVSLRQKGWIHATAHLRQGERNAPPPGMDSGSGAGMTEWWGLNLGGSGD